MKITRAEADELRASLLASLDLARLAERLDADLGLACARLVRDLGVGGSFRTGTSACRAAEAAIGAARARLGDDVVTSLNVTPSVCLVDVDVPRSCMSVCDSALSASDAKTVCDAPAGACDGDCTGTCVSAAPTACAGKCVGTCAGQGRGTCAGRCVGKCEGKVEGGVCNGVCRGVCEQGGFEGECRDACKGACELPAARACAGTCVGTCSVEANEAKCSSRVSFADAKRAPSAACRARCELAVVNATECVAPAVALAVRGARDRSGEAALRTAVTASFPALAKTLSEAGDWSATLTAARALVAGTRSWLEARRAGQDDDPVAQCFRAPIASGLSAADAATGSLAQATRLRDAAGVTPAR